MIAGFSPFGGVNGSFLVYEPVKLADDTRQRKPKQPKRSLNNNQSPARTTETKEFLHQVKRLSV